MMADLDDVLHVMADLISGAIYPNGTDHASAIGANVRIYPGWPVPNVLENDLQVGNAHISIFPRPEERNTTRYAPEYGEVVTTPTTITAHVSGNVVNIGGTISTPQAVMVLLNFGRSAYSYFIKDTDTPGSIAAALAAMIPGASAAGPAITITGAYEVQTQIITSGTATKEVRRQERLIQTVIWASTPDIRTAIAKVVDGLFARSPRFTLPDNTSARLTYKQSPMTDMLQKAAIYRRDLFTTVEYATTVTDTFFTIGTTEINITPPQ